MKAWKIGLTDRSDFFEAAYLEAKDFLKTQNYDTSFIYWCRNCRNY